MLAICAAVFMPTYLLVANLLGIIDADEKKGVRKLWRRIVPSRAVEQNV